MHEILTRPEPHLADDWMFALFLFVLVVLAWVRVRTPGYFSRLLNMFTNDRLMRQALQEENVSLRPDAAITFCYYLLGALLLVHLSALFGWKTGISSSPLNFLLFFTGLLSAYSVKPALLRFVGWLVRFREGIEEYARIISHFNRVLMLVLLVPLMLMTYLPIQVAVTLAWVALGLVVSVLIYRLWRGVQAAADARIPLTYILFYICTFEFLPLLVFYRVVNP
ncbi:MAG: DUF4271 domain-containing protein [Flavobacteriales bacterium]|nr:DUF4271 domain-containing protein [Flavobacteriales bacterium]